MPLSVITPSLPDADAYTDEASASAALQRRGTPAAWTAATTVEREIALVRATDLLDDEALFPWIGTRDAATQAHAWPRDGGVARPLALACALLAVDVLNGVDFAPIVGSTGAIASASVGPISATFREGGALSASADGKRTGVPRVRNPLVDGLVTPWLRSPDDTLSEAYLASPGGTTEYTV